MGPNALGLGPDCLHKVTIFVFFYGTNRQIFAFIH